MTDPVALYSRAADGFTSLVDGLSGDQWAAATPCAGWTVEDLVVHVIERDRGLAGSLGAAEPPAPDPDRQRRMLAGERVSLGPDDDLAAAWHAQRAWWADRLDDPATRDEMKDTFFGRMTFGEATVRLNLAELLIHSWDLASAIGASTDLDEEGVALAWENMQANASRIPRPGPLGELVPSAPDDDAQTKLLHFAGRRA